MPGPSTDAWFPVVTLILGFLTKTAADFFQDRRAARRAKEARAEDRFERIGDLSRSFQQENLLQLQEELASLMRLAGQANHHDVMATRKGAAWGKTFIPNDVDEGLRQSQARSSLLAARILDDEIREQAENVKSALTAAGFAASEAEALTSLNNATFAWKAFNDRTGLVLRKLNFLE